MPTEIKLSNDVTYVAGESPYKIVQAIKSSSSGWIVLTDTANKQFAVKHSSIEAIDGQEPMPSG